MIKLYWFGGHIFSSFSKKSYDYLDIVLYMRFLNSKLGA